MRLSRAGAYARGGRDSQDSFEGGGGSRRLEKTICNPYPVIPARVLSDAEPLTRTVGQLFLPLTVNYTDRIQGFAIYQSLEHASASARQPSFFFSHSPCPSCKKKCNREETENGIVAPVRCSCGGHFQLTKYTSNRLQCLDPDRMGRPTSVVLSYFHSQLEIIILQNTLRDPERVLYLDMASLGLIYQGETLETRPPRR